MKHQTSVGKLERGVITFLRAELLQSEGTSALFSPSPHRNRSSSPSPARHFRSPEQSEVARLLGGPTSGAKNIRKRSVSPRLPQYISPSIDSPSEYLRSCRHFLPFPSALPHISICPTPIIARAAQGEPLCQPVTRAPMIPSRAPKRQLPLRITRRGPTRRQFRPLRLYSSSSLLWHHRPPTLRCS